MAVSPPQTFPPEADFGRVARFYDLLAGLAFGGALRRAQRAALVAGLPPSPTPLRVLVLGGGAGWVLSELWRHQPTAQVLYLEVSAEMLARTRARLRRQPAPPGAAVELRRGSEAALQPGEQFDVLITFFVLDCFTAEALPGALARLQAARQPSAPWLVTDFRPAQSGWRLWLIQAMYRFFGLLVGLQVQRMPPWPAELASLGLRSIWKKSFFANAIDALVLH
ncbi:methyltransferase domain-containing protein [Hymenobacter sp. HMF4947]|uniref:Methyltransferase domain-containing protein n=1 Tax=Hymenobacter ginkgonis TaxID=2682976 RepID=A0A7K1TFM9_9BACT|nr:class I SAM-dependent methyltransferase [Hymenobacter ginkgonis]MVN77102.1 methyltransferase domain-containing protein [Hymenobacter ginkgonis]